MDPTRPEPSGPVEHSDLRKQLRSTGAILHTYLALSRVFEVDAVEKTAHDPTTLDLLLRVRLAPRAGLGRWICVAVA